MADAADAISPDDYIASLDEPRKTQIKKLHLLIRETVPDLEPHVQSGMLGYGRYHYKYASGREGDTFVVGIANNKRYISLYILGTEDDEYVAERFKSRLPKADIGKSCVRIKKLDDVDLDVVRELVSTGARALRSN
jgi:hypothetical protein